MSKTDLWDGVHLDAPGSRKVLDRLMERACAFFEEKDEAEEEQSKLKA